MVNNLLRFPLVLLQARSDQTDGYDPHARHWRLFQPKYAPTFGGYDVSNQYLADFPISLSPVPTGRSK